MAKNYYEILGVDKKATQDEIKSAYRKLVKQYHPDLHPDDKDAAAKFKEINEANETLSDEQKRAAYDYELEHPGAANFGGGAGGFSGQGFGGFGDIFNEFFGGGFGGSSSRAQEKEQGQDITVEVSLSFLDAAKGCTKEISYTRREPCAACSGTGAKNGTAYKTCEKCHGTGQVQYTAGSGFFRTVSVRACDACGGTGKIITDKCDVCGGKGYSRATTKVTLNIPAGADTNSYMTKKGYGQASLYGGAPGNLIVVFKVLPHKLFTRQGFDLYVTVPVSFATAALGGKVKVPTLDDVIDYDIPSGTQSGKQFVIRGKGIKSTRGTGNLFVTVNVEVPTSLSRDQKKAITDFEAGCEMKQTPKMREYSDNVEALYGKKPYAEKDKK